MNYWLLGAVAWLIIGIVAVAYCLWDDHRTGEDLTLGDLSLALFTVCAGPLFAVWLLRQLAKQYSGTVLIKGRNQNERGRND